MEPKKRRFYSLSIKVEPSVYIQGDQSEWHELEIQLRVGNKIVASKHILDADDFESRFDFTFDRAKEVLRREIQKLSTETKI